MDKRYSVPTVSCEHCKRAIEAALGDMDGVEKVTVDVAAKTVDVGFDDASREEAIKSRLSEEGYPVAD